MAFVYSCCFWFSLRLGGILIGLYSLVQGTNSCREPDPPNQIKAVLILITNCMAYTHVETSITILNDVTHDLNLIYMKDYVEEAKADPEKFFSLGIIVMSIYLIASIIFIYGAYYCNNTLMVPFLLLDLVRLIMSSVVVATILLVLKQNTMDIGLLIGASVAAGFFLLGEFYLWVCAFNLPILINEMEKDEQAATIEKLQRMLQSNQKTYANTFDNVPLTTDYDNTSRRDIFAVSRDQANIDRLLNRSKIPVPSNAFIRR